MIILEFLPDLVEGLMRKANAKLISQRFVSPNLQNISQIRPAFHLASTRACSFHLFANRPLLAALLGLNAFVVLRAESCAYQSRQVFEPATRATHHDFNSVTISIFHSFLFMIIKNVN